MSGHPLVQRDFHPSWISLGHSHPFFKYEAVSRPWLMEKPHWSRLEKWHVRQGSRNSDQTVKLVSTDQDYGTALPISHLKMFSETHLSLWYSCSLSPQWHFFLLEIGPAPPQLACVTHHYITHFVALIGLSSCVQMYFGLRLLEIKNEKKDSRLYTSTNCDKINQCQTSWEEIYP